MGPWDGTKKFLSHEMGRLSKNFRPIPCHVLLIKQVASHGTDGMGWDCPIPRGALVRTTTQADKLLEKRV